MKTFIKKPENKVEKLDINAIRENAGLIGMFGDLEGTLCSGLNNLTGKSDHFSFLNGVIDGIMRVIGCEEIQPEVEPEPECRKDSDCPYPEIQECDDHECVLEEGMCLIPSDCGQPGEGTEFECENNECEECHTLGEPCLNAHPCCDGLLCQSPFPFPSPTSTSRKARKLVENGNGIGPICCLPYASACDGNSDCCSGNCDEGTCTFIVL